MKPDSHTLTEKNIRTFNLDFNQAAIGSCLSDCFPIKKFGIALPVPVVPSQFVRGMPGDHGSDSLTVDGLI